MKLLQGSCDTPMVQDVLEIHGKRIIIMDCMQGVVAQSIPDNKDWGRAGQIYRNMGMLLASQIHSRTYNGQAQGIRLSNRDAVARIIAELEFVPSLLGRDSMRLLSAADTGEQPWVLTHGDYGVHNLLCEAEALHVLDWEWAEWGNPLNDVAWVCWFTKLHYPGQAEALNTAFIEGYLSAGRLPFSPQQLKASSVYKVWNVLYRLRIAPKEVQREWVRRLEWTLYEDFADQQGC
jgi:hypothetical protein